MKYPGLSTNVTMREEHRTVESCFEGARIDVGYQLNLEAIRGLKRHKGVKGA